MGRRIMPRPRTPLGPVSPLVARGYPALDIVSHQAPSRPNVLSTLKASLMVC